jgi:predicted RNA-binding protein with PUA-like domain
MAYWLFKLEPDVLAGTSTAKGDAGEERDGVLNYQARTTCGQWRWRPDFSTTPIRLEIVGIVEVCKATTAHNDDDTVNLR